MGPVIAGAVVALVLLAGTPAAGQDVPAEGDAVESDAGWSGIWGASPYGPYPAGPLAGTAPDPAAPLTSPTALPNDEAVDQTFRMIVTPTLGAETIRLRFSNLEGEEPLELAATTVGVRAVGAALVPGTLRPVTFDGDDAVVIPVGAEVASDPVDLAFVAGDRLAVSFHVPGPTGPLTWHAVSFDVQHLTAPNAGDHTADPSGASFTEVSVGWFLLSGIDRLSPATDGTVVTLGDSITDGAYQVPGSDTRYPDLLAARIRDAGLELGVVNAGINSNRVTAGGDPANGGQPAILRFDRDVLAVPGVTTVLIMEGTNDLAAGTPATEVIAAIEDLIARANAAGVCVVLGTIPPRDDTPVAPWDRSTLEPERRSVNAALRELAAGPDVVGLADFDAALGSPLDPTRPNPALFVPDLLHPNTVGFQVMADAVPLDALDPAACDTAPAAAPTSGRTPSPTSEPTRGHLPATGGGLASLGACSLLLGGWLRRRR